MGEEPTIRLAQMPLAALGAEREVVAGAATDAFGPSLLVKMRKCIFQKFQKFQKFSEISEIGSMDKVSAPLAE